MEPKIKSLVSQEIESYGIDRAKTLISSGRSTPSEIASVIRKRIDKTRLDEMMAIRAEMPLLAFVQDCLKIEAFVEAEITS